MFPNGYLGKSWNRVVQVEIIQHNIRLTGSIKPMFLANLMPYWWTAISAFILPPYFPGKY